MADISGTATGTSSAAGNLTKGSVLDREILKFYDLTPLIQNLNDGGHRDFKIGARGVLFTGRAGPDRFMMVFEAIGPSPDLVTGFMIASAPSLQGPWTVSPSTRVLTPNSSSPENDEVSPTALLISKDGTRVEAVYQYGHNTGPRLVGRAWANDGFVLQDWTRDSAGNPEIQAQGSETGVADGKGLRLANGNLDIVFKAFLATGQEIKEKSGSDWGSLTRSPSNPIVAPGPAGSWDADEAFGPGAFVDVDGRKHVFYCGDGSFGVQNAVGYAFFDASGGVSKGGTNPTMLANEGAGEPDNGIGDTLTAFPHGDVVVLFYGVYNLLDYPGGDLRGLGAGIHPYIQESPAREARFYYPGTSRAYTTLNDGVLDQTAFTILVRFRAFRLNRSVNDFRHFYTERAAFNESVHFRINNSGKLEAFYRSPTDLMTVSSAADADTGEYISAVFVRTASNAFELWMKVDGGSWSQVDTNATECGSTASVPDIAMGNSHPNSGDPDAPLAGTMIDLVLLHEAVTSTSEFDDILESRTFPGGSPVVDFPAGTGVGSNAGNVFLVDGTTPAPDTLLNPIDGTVSGTSTVTGTLSATGALAGASAGTSTVTGDAQDASAASSIAGTAAGTGVTTGTLAGIGAVVGTAAGTSTAAGTLVDLGALAGISVGTATTVGTVVASGTLAATAAGVATATGTLTGTGALAGTAPATSSAVGSLAGTAALQGTAAGTAMSFGTAQGSGALGGSVAGVSTALGALSAIGTLVGAGAGTSSTVGDLSGLGELRGLTQGIGTASGSIAALGAVSVSGSATGTSSASGTLTGLGELRGIAAGTSTANGRIASPVLVFPPRSFARLPIVDMAVGDQFVPTFNLSPKPTVDMAIRAPTVDLRECACGVARGQLDFELPRNSGWIVGAL